MVISRDNFVYEGGLYSHQIDNVSDDNNSGQFTSEQCSSPRPPSSPSNNPMESSSPRPFSIISKFMNTKRGKRSLQTHPPS